MNRDDGYVLGSRVAIYSLVGSTIGFMACTYFSESMSTLEDKNVWLVFLPFPGAYISGYLTARLFTERRIWHQGVGASMAAAGMPMFGILLGFVLSRIFGIL